MSPEKSCQSVRSLPAPILHVTTCTSLVDTRKWALSVRLPHLICHTTQAAVAPKYFSKGKYGGLLDKARPLID